MTRLTFTSAIKQLLPNNKLFLVPSPTCPEISYNFSANFISNPAFRENTQLLLGTVGWLGGVTVGHRSLNQMVVGLIHGRAATR